jgi:hypothetical protein
MKYLQEFEKYNSDAKLSLNIQTNELDFTLFESVKTQEKFFKDVEKKVKKYGGIVTNKTVFRTELEIMSEYGKYIISLHINKHDFDSRIYSIYGSFSNVDVLKDPIISQFTPNTLSGKCNFYNKNAKELIIYFDNFLSIITTPNIYTKANKYNIL